MLGISLTKKYLLTEQKQTQLNFVFENSKVALSLRWYRIALFFSNNFRLGKFSTVTNLLRKFAINKVDSIVKHFQTRSLIAKANYSCLKMKWRQLKEINKPKLYLLRFYSTTLHLTQFKELTQLGSGRQYVYIILICQFLYYYVIQKTTLFWSTKKFFWVESVFEFKIILQFRYEQFFCNSTFFDFLNMSNYSKKISWSSYSVIINIMN